MTASSVGVRLADDFEELPLFETPPLDGPTKVRIRGLPNTTRMDGQYVGHEETIKAGGKDRSADGGMSILVFYTSPYKQTVDVVYSRSI